MPKASLQPNAPRRMLAAPVQGLGRRAADGCPFHGPAPAGLDDETSSYIGCCGGVSQELALKQ